MFVEDFTCEDVWGKGGIMIRDSLTPGSAYVSLFVTGGNGLSKQWRDNDGGGTTDELNTSVDGRGAWLRISKIGTKFDVYYKIFGTDDWVAFGYSLDFPLSENYYVGIAVTSHDNAKTAELVWRYEDPTEFGLDIGSPGLAGRVTPSVTGSLSAIGSGAGKIKK